MHKDYAVKDLIKLAAKKTSTGKFSEAVEYFLTFTPEVVLELLPYFCALSEKDKQRKVVLSLIARSLEQLRFDYDKKSPKAQNLFQQIQVLLPELYHNANSLTCSTLNALLYDSQLPFSVDLPNNSPRGEEKTVPDIMPRIPELLEQTRKAHSIRSSFDLFEGLISQLHIMPAQMQSAIASELILSNKTMPHEVASMMLLHTDSATRVAISKMFSEHVTKNVFTALDLRRLIVIRNWLPSQERKEIDALIKKIRLQKTVPAPYPVAQSAQIVASCFDGAGAQLILFETKKDKQRIIGGFILKCGIGIREPWVNTKAARGEFEQITLRCEMELKPVTLTYVNKAVGHFLAEGHLANNVPSPFLLQIAELLGATEWQADIISIPQEIHRIAQTLNFDVKNLDEIHHSFERSAQWKNTEAFFRNWFECGELAEQSLQNVVTKKSRSTKKNPHAEITALTQAILLPVLSKWKTIILFMCLWARSKNVKEPLWQDLIILLDQIESNQTPLADIPVIQNIITQSVETILHNQNFY